MASLRAILTFNVIPRSYGVTYRETLLVPSVIYAPTAQALFRPTDSMGIFMNTHRDSSYVIIVVNYRIPIIFAAGGLSYE
jgi:hypothetical protein